MIVPANSWIPNDSETTGSLQKPPPGDPRGPPQYFSSCVCSLSVFLMPDLATVWYVQPLWWFPPASSPLVPQNSTMAPFSVPDYCH